MATQDFATSLEVLEDGQVKVITLRKNVIYLQPVIIVDAYLDIENLEVKGSRNEEVRVNVTNVTSIDGTAFSGTFAALEVALRELALKANGLLNGGVSGGGGNVVVTNNTDPSTATKQNEQSIFLDAIDGNSKRKKIGALIDLSADLQGNWGGFPVQAASITLLVNGDSLEFNMNDLESATSEDLAQQLNNAQDLVVFDYISGQEKITFNGVKVSNIEVQGFLIEDNNVGSLGYANFVNSTDDDTGAIQQIALLAQAQVQLQKDLNNKTPKIKETLSLSYTGSLTKTLTSSPDIYGQTIPLGSRGDISSIQDLGAGNVNYRFDSGVPSSSDGTISGNRPFDKLTNVNFDTFRVKAQAGAGSYTIILNLYN